MADLSRPDLCIIGAGALGIELAQHARRLGGSVLLVDRGAPEPGDEPQQALRLAALQASAAKAHAVRTAGAFGVGRAEPKVSMRAVQQRALELAGEHAPLTSRDRLTALGIDILRGQTRFADPHTLLVGELQIKPRAIVLATGAVPRIPELPGLAQIGFFTPQTILDNTRKLTHLLVLGADATGFVLAQTFSRLGAEVTLVPQGKALPGYDAESVGILLAELAAEGVRVIDGGVVLEIQPRAQGIGATVALAGGDEIALDLSHVLVADGSHADVDGLEPLHARLRVGQGHYATGRLGQTSNRRIRVAGAAAGLDHSHYALKHGRAVIEDLIKGSATLNALQPRLVATEPGLAQIGNLPGDAEATAKDMRLYRESFVANEQAGAAMTVPGLIKVVALPRGHVVGASIVGPGAAELAGVLALAMEKGLALRDLAGLSLPHPSLMTSLVRLGEQDLPNESASGWGQRIGSIRRMLPF